MPRLLVPISDLCPQNELRSSQRGIVITPYGVYLQILLCNQCIFIEDALPTNPLLFSLKTFVYLQFFLVISRHCHHYLGRYEVQEDLYVFVLAFQDPVLIYKLFPVVSNFTCTDSNRCRQEHTLVEREDHGMIVYPSVNELRIWISLHWRKKRPISEYSSLLYPRLRSQSIV